MQINTISDWKNDINYFDFGPPLFSIEGAIYLQSQLHGNETMGTLVLSDLISVLKKLKEDSIKKPIRIVPRANPFSWNAYQYTRNGLYDPTSGDNWNRIFDWQIYHKKTKEILKENKSIPIKKLLMALERFSKTQQKTNRLKDYLSSKLFELSIGYDLIVDVHTPENGIEHLYCSKYDYNTPKFEVPYIIEYGTPKLNTFDEAHNRLNQILGKKRKNEIGAITLEIDSNYPAQIKTIKRWTNRIFNQLVDYKIIESTKIKPEEKGLSNKKFIGSMIDFNSHISGIQIHHFKLGDTITKGAKVFEIRPFANSDENEIVYSDFYCIPLCLRKHNLVSSGNWVVRALKIDHVEK